jgi:CYTH domain-containing protein
MSNEDREIERKYLLRSLPPVVAAHPAVEIDQGYIPGTQVRERVRRITGGALVRYVRTIKVGTGMNRFEFEEDSSEEFFATVWPLTQGHRLRKRRYRMPGVTGVWEIDEFLDRDLVLAEIELTHEDQVVVVPPEIAAVMDREVTDDPSFSNYKLSR